jgi:hypothetical protein
MKGKAKGLLVIVVLLSVINAAGALPAANESFSGKIDLLQVTSQGTRFFVRTQTPTLSLYATGEYKDVLLQGFFRKATFSIGYTVIPCPAGIQGKCGNVFLVSVESAAF